MLSHDEKERLLREVRCEPAWAVGVVLKCAVCLLILAGLAWIGISAGPDQEPAFAFGPPAAGVPAPHRERASVVDARKVFEERRARFGSPQDSGKAMPRALLANPVNAAGGPRADAHQETLLRTVD